MALSAQAGPAALTSDLSSCNTIDDTSCGGSSESNGEGNYYYAYTFNNNGPVSNRLQTYQVSLIGCESHSFV